MNMQSFLVYLREDYNIPMIKKKLINLNKIILSIPNIKILIKRKVSIVIISHLGNPKKTKYNSRYSTYSICKILSILLKKDIMYFSSINEQISKMRPGQIALVENIRFYKNEKKCAIRLSKIMSLRINLFLNNAFSSCHRKHSSNHGITKFIGMRSIGLLIKKEINIIRFILKNKNLDILISGGSNKYEKIILNYIIIQKSKIKYLLLGSKNSNKIHFNKNKTLSDIVKHSILAREFIFEKKTGIIRDIGKSSIKKYTSFIDIGRVILWNGPLGLFEKKDFETSTRIILNKIVNTKQSFLILGGGETGLSVEYYNLKKYIQYMSTGGGAMLSCFAKVNLYYKKSEK